MNDLAREKLIEAALNGTRQIKGFFADGQGGYCAMGVLGKAAGIEEIRLCSLPSPWLDTATAWDLDMVKSVECDLCHSMSRGEDSYIAHLNDEHDLDFLTIARKI